MTTAQATIPFGRPMIGDADLNFMTVEFLDSANKPLPVPDRVRLSRS